MLKTKQDPKLVASVESHEGEVRYIAKTYKIPIKEVRLAMKASGKNGKPGRSRKMIYAKLHEMGWVIKTKKYG